MIYTDIIQNPNLKQFDYFKACIPFHFNRKKKKILLKHVWHFIYNDSQMRNDSS